MTRDACQDAVGRLKRPFRYNQSTPPQVFVPRSIHAGLSRFPPSRPRSRSAQGRSHGDGDAVGFRLSDALRSPPRLSIADYEEGPHKVDRPRVAVVFAGRDERSLAAGARGDDLGRVGRRERRPWTDLRIPVAKLARARRPPYRPDRARADGDPPQSGFSSVDRVGLERRGYSADEATAVPCVLSVLRRRWPLIVSAVSA